MRSRQRRRARQRCGEHFDCERGTSHFGVPARGSDREDQPAGQGERYHTASERRLQRDTEGLMGL